MLCARKRVHASSCVHISVHTFPEQLPHLPPTAAFTLYHAFTRAFTPGPGAHRWGRSAKGRDLLALEVYGGGQDERYRPTFKFVGNLHGDEPSGRCVCAWEAWVGVGNGVQGRCRGQVSMADLLCKAREPLFTTHAPLSSRFQTLNLGCCCWPWPTTCARHAMHNTIASHLRFTLALSFTLPPCLFRQLLLALADQGKGGTLLM